jgi:hypothetical protein
MSEIKEYARYVLPGLISLYTKVSKVYVIIIIISSFLPAQMFT